MLNIDAYRSRILFCFDIKLAKGRIDADAYEELVQDAKDFLGGKSTQVQQKLAVHMQAASDAMQRLAPHRAAVHADGPPLLLRPGQALPLMMTLAEWFANSAKYGAHSVAGGSVEIHWGVVVGCRGHLPPTRSLSCLNASHETQYQPS